MGYKQVQDSSTSQRQEKISPWQTALEIGPQATAGVAAALPGVFGNAAKFGYDILTPIAESIEGKKSAPYEKSWLGKLLPTTQTHLKNLQEIPLFKPKNKVQEFAQNVAVDAAELFTPGGALKMGRYAMTPLRSLGISLMGNLAGKGTESFSGDKSKGEMVKSGTMLGLSLLRPETARSMVSGLYERATTLLPQNATVNATPFLNRLNAMRNSITRGRPVAGLSRDEQYVLGQIDNFQNLSQNGHVNVNQLLGQKQSFHADSRGQIFDTADRTARRSLRNRARELSNIANETMETYGRQNPQWWELQRGADTAHGAMEQSNIVSRQLERFMKSKPAWLAHLFGGSAVSAASAISPTVGASLGGGYQAAKIGYRVVNSPELAKHYAKVVGAAATENVPKINAALNKFEEAVEKDNKKRGTKYKQVP